MGTGNARAASAAPVPKGRHFAEHVIAIAAPPQRVWALLADFAGWGAWNPLYPETRGELTEGGTIAFTVRLEGLKPQQGQARVLTVEPGHFIQYQVRAMAGLALATRYILLEDDGAGAVRVTNGEIMGGLLGGLLYRAAGEKVRRGLEGMNLALKSLAEKDGEN